MKESQYKVFKIKFIKRLDIPSLMEKQYFINKKTKKIVLSQVKSLTQIIVKFRTEKNCLRVFHPPDIGHQVSCSNTLKRNELKVYISPKENKLACFTNG